MERISALHTDKYQINMMFAHWVNGTHEQKAVFEVYFRSLPFGNGYAVFAGLERIIDYISQLHFTDEEIDFLRTQPENYPESFLQELKKFHFSGSISAVEEGTLVFPSEPLVRVEGTIFETQLIETAILNFINYQTLVATKASRIKQVSPQDTFLEFGSRRAHEEDAALWGTRAAYVAGFDGTSNVLAGMKFGIPVSGTHAHSWVQDHESELEAFERFAKAMPDHVVLLVDTYDTLRSGVPHAIQVGLMMKQQGKQLKGIRLDSGDLAYLSIEARKMLDEAGLTDVKIVASNDLDEATILNLKAQGAKIDTWGVGTKLITAYDQPALGGVYKLVARESNGKLVPAIKISGNPEKISNPGKKKLYRIFDPKTNKAIADYMTLIDEQDVEESKPIKLYHPTYPFISKGIKRYHAVSLLRDIYRDGKLVYDLPQLDEIRSHHQAQLQMFWPEYTRQLNPEIYKVSLSEKAYLLKMKMIEEHRTEKDDPSHGEE
ncbi:nicotinate phosphoribosyltransferase [Marinicrinis lubricantis]|uniref:Nicotinate phosphoribosyltransferase n=1 Tax=Marinicrinis lubricantis TaxID=2086470 RepID=A0ABW1IL62_9BACL